MHAIPSSRVSSEFDATLRRRALRASLLQSLQAHAWQLTTPSFRALFTKHFPLPFVAKAAGSFRRMAANFSMPPVRPPSSTLATAFPRLGEPWPRNPRNSPLPTPHSFIPRLRKSWLLAFLRSPLQIFKMAAAFTSHQAAPKPWKRPSSSPANSISKNVSPLVTVSSPVARAITAARSAR